MTWQGGGPIIPALLRPRKAILGLLLVYQALFLNVVLPGHSRGAVTLDGRHTADLKPCCCCGGSGDPSAGHPGPAVPSRRDREHCAICQFAAGLSPAPFLHVTLAPAGLLDRLPDPPPDRAVPADPALTYLACGPPTIRS